MRVSLVGGLHVEASGHGKHPRPLMHQLSTMQYLPLTCFLLRPMYCQPKMDTDAHRHTRLILAT